MKTKTYITETNNNYALANGNASSEQEWDEYQEAVDAMTTDNELAAEAIRTDNPDLYHDNSQISWVA